MRLHKDRNIFEQIIAVTSEERSIPEEQVEKDYYVSLMLKNLVQQMPQVVFKGGTSLSKCYGVIQRFSEDIDIHYAVNRKPSQNDKRVFKQNIEQAILQAELTLLNSGSIRSRSDHNLYEVAFAPVTSFSESVRRELLIETYVPIKAFPVDHLEASSYIFQYLHQEEENELIETYSLSPFKLNVQRIDRTFIDKLFALCDYYDSKKFARNSRHLYDLHRIWSTQQFEKEEFRVLFEQVRRERQLRQNVNVSSADGYPLADNLRSILESDVFKSDYLGITNTLLFEACSYETAKAGLSDFLALEWIIDSDE
ncbi:nucleotidyl transferase AbiEii/AbiGii toxin family protein [Saccharibacillus sp. CPCC 101409]|uniref:nucleotidyl transferase AbiEii/AbiGii toxin family protein n=1 Tax=Saccharibacillus sp. CPCC 101409 TaxID=3058041 RepID=UPI002673EACE|nr:nucleotidyl transferase AbiEii/AbiGii toxin family protein [Saccharibacillus sp. CPCC 101409]MDO3411197.1 nucleotidyl transferase AbiEii/AbiGii toxin family protein [Saccharibacillus sp. CPCC 101409]